MKQQNRELITLAALARRLDLPHSRATRFLNEGLLTPDHTSGNTRLFNASRIRTIAARLQRAGVI